jgi:hypothetical protein
MLIDTNTWRRSRMDVFWGEIAPTDHVLHIYENEEVFLDLLAGFAGAGINSEDSVVIIGTGAHLEAIRTRLEDHGISVDSLLLANRYLPLEADAVLSNFMRDGLPDEELFMNAIYGIMNKVKGKGKIRAFGEMVAILWAQGNKDATVKLEELWNKFCQKEELCLFCAYPKNGFTSDESESFNHICSNHSKMIAETEKPLSEILYQEIIAQAV